MHTTDAGSSWSTRPLPTALMAVADSKANGYGALAQLGAWGSPLKVRFANPLDGWAYGGFPNDGPFLWATQDGGVTWHDQQLPDMSSALPVLDLEAAGATAYLVTVNADLELTVESSPVSQDLWGTDQAPVVGIAAGGSQEDASIVLQGGEGWLVEGNDRGVAGAELQSGGQWRSWAPLCYDVGVSDSVPAAASATYVVAARQIGGWLDHPLPKSAPRRAKFGSCWLYFSGNSGNSFQAGPELGRGYDCTGLVASPSPGVIFIDRAGDVTTQLMASFDGGHHWDAVYPGTPFYLGFTSAGQGVGLVWPTGGSPATAMIMTFDGGHRWERVKF